MKKNIIWIVLSLFLFGFFWTWVFASNDCSMVKTNLRWHESEKKIWFGNLYPDAAFNQALMNLKAYCCESNAFALDTEEVCSKDRDYFVDDYPESDYLYDHLIDIALRRLDASSDMYWLDPDPKGLEWRNYISKKIGESSDPWFALAMEKKYKEYWQMTTNEYTPYVWSWTNKMSAQEIFELSTQYPNANLYQRYIETCGIAAQVYMAYAENTPVNSKAIIKSSGYGYCKDMVNQRISDEILYTKTQMSDKSSKLLQSSVEAYLTNYFAKNKLMHLQETVLFISDLFLSVAKMVPEWTKECH